jgi:nitronate monooxygenase
VVLHDIINNTVRAQGDRKGRRRPHRRRGGAGGPLRASRAPSRLIQEIRRWFDGPIALSGRHRHGGAVLAAQAMGADFATSARPSSPRRKARASDAYKQCIVESSSDDIVYSSLFTGVHGNYLKPVRSARPGLDPGQPPESDPSKMNFGGGEGCKPKAWKEIWGSGQGIGAVNEVGTAAARRAPQARVPHGAAAPAARPKRRSRLTVLVVVAGRSSVAPVPQNTRYMKIV